MFSRSSKGSGPAPRVSSDDPVHLSSASSATPRGSRRLASDSLIRHQSVSVFSTAPSTPNLAATVRVQSDRVYAQIEETQPVNISIYKSQRCELIETTPCGGSDPRDFVLDPSGSWILVANQSSNTISRLELDPQTLVPHNPHVVAELSSPTCIILQESPS